MQVTLALGAIPAGPHVNGAPMSGSSTKIGDVVVTLPVLVTVNSKVITSVTAEYDVAVPDKTDFRISSSGAWVALTDVPSDPDAVSPAIVTSTEAVLLTAPASKSACVTA